MARSVFLLGLATLAASAAWSAQTVGELLQEAGRGGSLSSQNKQAVAVPTVTLPATTRNHVDLRQVKPPRMSRLDDNDKSDRAELDRITDQQINELYKLTERFKTSPQRGELWLRLGELYVEKASLVEFRAQGEFDVRLKAYQTGKTQEKPKLNLSEAKVYNKRALQLYEWFVRDFPKDKKVDQALFFLGYNSYELGELKKGTFYYDQLTREHPASPFLIEAHFALAEFYFENERWAQAQEHYQMVVNHPRHRLYTFSLYKLAWCFYRTGHSREALKTMEQLIALTKQEMSDPRRSKGANRGRLETEGLRDIVLFYADVGDAAQAPEYFKAIAGNEANSYIEKLAYFYADKGNESKAQILFDYLIESNPTSAKAFDYKYQIVQLLTATKNSKEFRDQLFSWAHDYDASSKWYQANQGNKELIDNSIKLREATVRTFTLQNHQTAQNSHAAFSQKVAGEGYRLYFEEFPQAALVSDMHFYYGELLYDMGKFDLASEQYRWVVENAPQSKFFNRAGENVLLSMERDVPKDSEIAARVGKSLDPVEFDPKVQRFVQIAVWYLGKFPNSDKAVEIKFRTGRLYYQHNQFDKAIPYFREIVQKHPNTKYAEYSANLLLDIYNLKKDYVGLEKVANEILAIKSIANSKTGADIRDVLEKASFKKCQDLELAKDYMGSANQYSKFAHTYPNSTLAPAAHFNAAINYERVGAVELALNEHSTLQRSTGPQAEPLKVKSERIVAKLYQDAGRLEESARAYEKAGERLSPKDPLATNLFFNAAIIFEAMGENNRALVNYKKSFADSKSEDRFENLFQMAELARKSGNSTEAETLYTQYYRSGRAKPENLVASAYWVYSINKARKKTTEQEQWGRRTIASFAKEGQDSTGPGAEYVAKVKLDQALVVYAELRAIRIPSSPKRQQEAAKKKISILEDLNKQLSKVVKYDSPEEIVAALTILGESNLHMSQSLTDAPLPEGLPANQVKAYHEGIEKLAAPFMNKAKESLHAAIAKSSELETYTTYSRKAAEILNDIEPEGQGFMGAGIDERQSAWGG